MLTKKTRQNPVESVIYQIRTQTLCSLSCHESNGSPFNYSWTKNCQVPVSDDIKIMNNIIVLTPRDAEDCGVYVCHATNSFGSATYKITVSEGYKPSAWAGMMKGVSGTHMNGIKSIRPFVVYVKHITSKISYFSLRCYANTDRVG